MWPRPRDRLTEPPAAHPRRRRPRSRGLDRHASPPTGGRGLAPIRRPSRRRPGRAGVPSPDRCQDRSPGRASTDPARRRRGASHRPVRDSPDVRGRRNRRLQSRGPVVRDAIRTKEPRARVSPVMPSGGRRWQDADMTTERIEVQRTIAADPATIFRVLSDPQGHVTIDSSGHADGRDRRAGRPRSATPSSCTWIVRR